MAWKLKTVLDSIAIVLIVWGESGLLPQPYGHLLAALGVAVKAAAEYLYQKGVIEAARA